VQTVLFHFFCLSLSFNQFSSDSSYFSLLSASLAIQMMRNGLRTYPPKVTGQWKPSKNPNFILF
jgi:hypothetical protein